MTSCNRQLMKCLKYRVIFFMNFDSYIDNEMCNDLNSDIVQSTLVNIDRKPDRRLIIPLPWNDRCKDQLGHNYNLSKKILQTNRYKLANENKLIAYDEVF